MSQDISRDGAKVAKALAILRKVLSTKPSRTPPLRGQLSPTERDCLLRATGQDGRFFPQPGYDSATLEVIRTSLTRKSFLTTGDTPCITPAGEAAIQRTRGQQLADH